MGDLTLALLQYQKDATNFMTSGSLSALGSSYVNVGLEFVWWGCCCKLCNAI
jgi:hypothetical protein